jgi:hypothetical protein
MTGKRCSKCKSLQPLYRYYKKAKAADGLGSECVDCHADEQRVKRHHIKVDRPQPYWGAGR